MGSINYKESIKESETYLENHLSTLTNPKLRNRCEVLLWLKSGRVRSMRAAMRLKGMNKSQGSNWWKQYISEGLSAFLQLKYKGQPSQLTDKLAFKTHLDTVGFSTINEARIWILNTYGIEYTENGLGNYFRTQKIKLKTGRPHHPKQSLEARESYKKKI